MSSILRNNQLLQSAFEKGVEAVDSSALIEKSIRIEKLDLWIGDRAIPLNAFDRVIVVGAGKASAGMAAGLNPVLERLVDSGKEVDGWVNVPDDCVREDLLIRIHGGRPAGVNLPTEKGVAGANAILSLVQQCKERDVVVVLISGGGSALLPLPIPGVSIAEKSAVTRMLSERGANIDELNLVRRSLSQIKGGGLIRNFQGHSLHSLLLSDVMGNPLETIASGPTVPVRIDFQKAIDVLTRFRVDDESSCPGLIQCLRKAAEEYRPASSLDTIQNLIVGDISTAVMGTSRFLQDAGVDVLQTWAEKSEPDVELVADQIWKWLQAQVELTGESAKAWVSGGEPTVTLSSVQPAGKGGRNQHLTLLLLKRILQSDLTREESDRIHFLSCGTDGEDGPTDAAGAMLVDAHFLETPGMSERLDEAIKRSDAYHFFESHGGLIKTGPTHTNVCDLRIAFVTPDVRK